MRTVLKNFHVVDEEIDMPNGNVIIENGIITDLLPCSAFSRRQEECAAVVIDGSSLSEGAAPVLMPAFVDLHAHFRDPGFPDKETLESASLSAVAGGFCTVICMANTKPVIDTIEKAARIKKRADTVGLVDLYPVISLTRGMEGRELSEISAIAPKSAPAIGAYVPLMLSEDGKDLADDVLFLEAMNEAKRIGIPISCHCDFGGEEAEAAKKSGQGRSVWSRIEENNAVHRVIALGKKAGCHIHIAHVSTKEAVQAIAAAKAERQPNSNSGFVLTCEVMPHNLCLTEETAQKLGEESWGRVNPSLRHEQDRKALVKAVMDGTIDAIATDHAPHSNADKEAGAPGFSAFETAFAAAFTELAKSVNGSVPVIDLMRLSSLLSASPAKLAGLSGHGGRGRILPGMMADLVIVDTEHSQIVDPERFKTRGKNSPFMGMELFGKVLLTLRGGRVVFASQ